MSKKPLTSTQWHLVGTAAIVIMVVSVWPLPLWRYTLALLAATLFMYAAAKKDRARRREEDLRRKQQERQ